MALPTLDKTWQHSVNQFSPASNWSEQGRRILFGIKQSLVGFASNPWQVVASSNSVSVKNVGDASPDLWLVYTNVVFASSGAHSWIVFRQGTGQYVCFDCLVDSTYSFQLTVYVSQIGFNADGTTSSCPTASDRWAVCTKQQYGPSTLDSRYTRYHVIHSADGDCTRIFMGRYGYITGFMLFETVKDPPALFTIPKVNLVKGTNADGPEQITLANMFGGTFTPQARLYTGGPLVNMHFSTLYGASYYLPGVFASGDDNSLEWPLFPVGVVCTTVSHRGHRGYLYDIWPGGLQTGTTYPEDGSRQLAHFGCLAVPWNGTDPVVY